MLNLPLEPRLPSKLVTMVFFFNASVAALGIIIVVSWGWYCLRYRVCKNVFAVFSCCHYAGVILSSIICLIYHKYSYLLVTGIFLGIFQTVSIQRSLAPMKILTILAACVHPKAKDHNHKASRDPDHHHTGVRGSPRGQLSCRVRANTRLCGDPSGDLGTPSVVNP